MYFGGCLVSELFLRLNSFTVSFTFPCDWKAGLKADPSFKGRLGFVSTFHGAVCGFLLLHSVFIFIFGPVGIGVELEKDLIAVVPFTGSSPIYNDVHIVHGTPNTAKVVGIIVDWSWNGGVGDPIQISFMCSRVSLAAES